MPGNIIDIAARSDADTAYLSRQGVGEIIAIEVQSGNNIELLWAGKNLLEGDVSDGVFDQDSARSQGFFLFLVGGRFALFLFGAFPLIPRVNPCAEFLFS